MQLKIDVVARHEAKPLDLEPSQLKNRLGENSLDLVHRPIRFKHVCMITEVRYVEIIQVTSRRFRERPTRHLEIDCLPKMSVGHSAFA